ncbi:hypothetical protein C0Z10_08145 [Acidipropionibacterium jensenii]|uniref:Uncharacterized protein n=1 Tax=Acidipropionibacterium jensenii TaxID=1749 RepID=A0A3Q9UJN4_9ACTN|nr:hypothetical protein C0Z10_08145 [Acidipropionibacterium jensenii]
MVVLLRVTSGPALLVEDHADDRSGEQPIIRLVAQFGTHDDVLVLLRTPWATRTCGLLRFLTFPGCDGLIGHDSSFLS